VKFIIYLGTKLIRIIFVLNITGITTEEEIKEFWKKWNYGHEHELSKVENQEDILVNLNKDIKSTKKLIRYN